MTEINQKKICVFLDSGITLPLYKSEVSKFHIELEGILSKSVFLEIMEILQKRARERALYLLKTKDKTEKEIRDKLRLEKYPDDVIEKVIEFLTQYGYVDDGRFAHHYLECYKERKSTRQIQSELLQKGISQECIRKLLEECPCDEEKAIQKYLQKKRIELSSVSPKETQKIYANLMRKGFSYEAIQNVLKPVWENDKGRLY